MLVVFFLPQCGLGKLQCAAFPAHYAEHLTRQTARTTTIPLKLLKAATHTIIIATVCFSCRWLQQGARAAFESSTDPKPF